jgi:hypothetical protein
LTPPFPQRPNFKNPHPLYEIFVANLRIELGQVRMRPRETIELLRGPLSPLFRQEGGDDADQACAHQAYEDEVGAAGRGDHRVRDK